MSRNFPEPEETNKFHRLEVQQAKDEWESTVDSLPQVICLLDRQACIIRINKTVAVWDLGRTEDVRGMGLHRLFHPECTNPNCYINHFLVQAWKDVGKGQSAECEGEDEGLNRYLHLHIRPISDELNRKHRKTSSFAVLIVDDITERKHAEKDRTRLATAVEQASESIVITDPEGVIQYVNPAVEQTSGYSQEEVIGQTTGIFKSGKHNNVFYHDLWETIQRGEVWSGSFVNKKKDGTLYYEDETISPVLDSSGKIINYVAIKRDTTHEIMLEERLRQSQKMEAVGLMAGGIAHEINQPLNSIKVIVDGMLFWHREGKQRFPEETLHKLEKVSREADRINDIVQHMRSFFRQDLTQQFKPIDLTKIVESALPLIAERATSQGIALQSKLSGLLPKVLGNVIELEQVLINLISNAIRALDSVQPENKQILISAYSETDFVFLQVKDTGVGIPQGMEEEIFNPLFTTREKKSQNLGLGLAIVRTILDAMGAVIDAENHPDGGASFTIRFPALSS